MRTLIVEDTEAGQLLLSTVLARYGECVVAVNGRAGVEAFAAAHAEGRPYDLVCMDVMMPEMDGWMATAMIRDMEEVLGQAWDQRARIIMMTAVDGIRDVAHSFRCLCDAHLVKPLTPATVRAQLQALALIDSSPGAGG